MRIAIEGSTWVNRRGYGRFTRELTRALVRAGSPHELTLVLDSGAAIADDFPEGIARAVVRTSEAVVSAASAAGARSVADMWRMAVRLSRFDAVLFPTVYSFVPIVPGPHVTVVIHDALPETMPDLVMGSPRARLFWRLKSAWACRRADLLATVSQASATEVRRHFRTARKPLAVLTEGVAAPFSTAAAPDDCGLTARFLPPDGRMVLYVGGLSPHKRVPDLIGAFGTAAARSGAGDLYLVLAGPNEEDSFTADRSAVAAAIEALGEAGRRVVRTGFVPDETLAALYRAACCVVLPSLAEGFGLPALEAMSCGAPLIVRRTPALEELCGDAADYMSDGEELAALIARLLIDEQRRADLSRAGVARAARFGWDESARRLLEALDRGIAAGRAHSPGTEAPC